MTTGSVARRKEDAFRASLESWTVGSALSALHRRRERGQRETFKAWVKSLRFAAANQKARCAHRIREVGGTRPERHDSARGDRRACRRIPAARRVAYQPGSAGDTWASGALADLGVGGLFVRTPEPPARGTRILIRFSVEHGDGLRSLRCRGEVCWVAGEDHADGAGFGMRFVDLDVLQSAILRRAVADHQAGLTIPGVPASLLGRGRTAAGRRARR